MTDWIFGINFRISGYSENRDFPIKNNTSQLSPFLNDEVAISTWITKCDYKIKLSRVFQAIRIKDDKTVFRSRVDYVCISLENYKPKKFPDLFKKTYKVTTE